jgi:putative ABC transport system ATP-binding protein
LHESLTTTQDVLMGLQVHGGGNAAKQHKAAHHILDLIGLADRRAETTGRRGPCLGVKSRNHSSRRTYGRIGQGIGTYCGSNPEIPWQSAGTTTVMVTHDPRVLEMADRIITLEDGRVVSDKLQ